MVAHFTLFIFSLLLLYYGAKWLVTASASLAKKYDISSTVIGLTIVSFGTSIPELAVSLFSVYKDQNMIAIGNIIGSNICNLTFVLGIISLIKPTLAKNNAPKIDIIIILLSSLCFFIFSLDSALNKIEGIAFLIGTLIYLHYKYRTSKKNKVNSKSKINSILHSHQYKKKHSKFLICTIVLGIIFLTLGSEMLVNNVKHIILILNVNSKFAGLIIVAIGTSIPELVTSIIAIIKKEISLSIGNLIGSNIFNILSVIGITAAFKPIKIYNGFIQSGLILDYSIMITTTLIPLLVIGKNKQVSKFKSIGLILFYLLYINLLLYKN